MSKVEFMIYSRANSPWALPGVEPVKNVLEGNVQFGVGTSALLLERKAGNPVVVLAVIFQHSPYVLIARQINAAQTIHDLIGKRVGSVFIVICTMMSAPNY